MDFTDYQKFDYLPAVAGDVDSVAIEKVRAEKMAYKFPTGTAIYGLMPLLQKMAATEKMLFSVDGPVVKIGDASFAGPDRVNAEAIMQLLKPWKKGPYEVFGTHIDTEWKSDRKWNRILPHLGEIEGSRIADIGASNGYFMFRLAEHNPELVVGFEPFMKLWYHFVFLQHYAQIPSLTMEPLGIEHMHYYPNFFDTVMCLGILYHHTDPVGLLRKVYRSLKPSGKLVVECQGIAGEESLALCPQGRYAGARSIWFLPTLSCLMNWLKRSQFQNIEYFFAEPLSTDEQRQTEWAPIASLSDFLDPHDNTKTIEGYPAPWRMYVKATK